MEGEGTSNGYANTKSVMHLQARLNEDKTVQAIDRLLNRIDTLEKSVEHLTIIMDQGPGLAAMTVDIADEAYRKANARGVSIENRLTVALQMAEKLTAPAMIEKLDGLLKLADQGPGLLSMGVDMVDEGLQRSASNGVYIEERLGNALALAEKLTAPEMVAKLDSLLQLADQAPGLVSMAVDSFDEQMGKMNQNGVDLQTLMELGQDASTAISKATSMPEAKVGGIFSMLRTMKDPDRQRAIGFVMNIAKAFGQQMKEKGK